MGKTHYFTKNLPAVLNPLILLATENRNVYNIHEISPLWMHRKTLLIKKNNFMYDIN